MTENKRFWILNALTEYSGIKDKDKLLTFNEVVDLLNEFYKENKELQFQCNQLQEEANEFHRGARENANRVGQLKKENKELKEENEQLKSTIKEVIELLSEEVDLFTYKATEHDINAYIELKELDNKDAFYMAIATKKAIKMLKELQE